jgi:hypothetical protein
MSDFGLGPGPYNWGSVPRKALSLANRAAILALIDWGMWRLTRFLTPTTTAELEVAS